MLNPMPNFGYDDTFVLWFYDKDTMITLLANDYLSHFVNHKPIYNNYIDVLSYHHLVQRFSHSLKHFHLKSKKSLNKFQECYQQPSKHRVQETRYSKL